MYQKYGWANLERIPDCGEPSTGDVLRHTAGPVPQTNWNGRPRAGGGYWWPAGKLKANDGKIRNDLLYMRNKKFCCIVKKLYILPYI